MSHHYVLRRSICFIVDTEYSGIFYHEKANKYVKQVFESLDDEDYFGFISLDRTPFPEQSTLQKKGNNTLLQQKFLKMMRKKDPNLLFAGGAGAARSESRLEVALKKAMKWQTTLVEDTKTNHNGHTYYGPHKQIVCLIGSDIYSVNTFKSQYERQFA